jgi:DNA-binding MarR family transcriptional regulator
MRAEDDADEIARVAGALMVSMGLFSRRLKQAYVEGDARIPEMMALARLEREGQSTPGALAALEQISPQSMGATLRALESRKLVSRGPDAMDGRRVVFSITEAGRQTLLGRRRLRTEQVAQALTRSFTGSERKQLMAATPLIERLAQAL